VYYGGFALPDKNASANRVVSNGKLFDSLGYETLFLGACYDAELSGMWQISENMFEESHPATTAEWVKQILCFSNLKKLSEEYKNLKMVLLYNVPFITLVLAKKYFSKKGVTVAYDCTEWTQFTEGSFLKKVFKYADEVFIRKFAHKVADKMIVISSLMEKAYKSDKKLLRLPPLVDVKDEIWHQPIEKNENSFTFCFSGFPGGNKESLDKVVEAFERLNIENAILKIVGLTEKDFFELYPHVKQIINKNIKFLGAKNHKESIKNILDCDCYIFIRSSDRRNNAGFPTKFAESFTCGVPIITTDVSDVKEYINLSNGSVLLGNCETESILKAMETVFDKSKKPTALKTVFHYAEYKNKAKIWLE
jgi:glycosyltransferase involved in cell wall biosynthesis